MQWNGGRTALGPAGQQMAASRNGGSVRMLAVPKNSCRVSRAVRARPITASPRAILERSQEYIADSRGSTRAETASVAAFILGGGAGTRLYPLTKRRAKPAVPIGGAYRLIDVPMSNCINSGITKVYILTQFNSTSLNRHLARAYSMGSGVRAGGDGFVEVLAATQTPTDKEWFMGTADAVHQYSWIINDTKNRVLDDIIILSGDHLYRMDHMAFVHAHRESGADITISCVPYDESRASDFGLMKIDGQGHVIEFAEKPKGDALKAMRVDTTVLGLSKEEAEKKPYIASMGIYVFKKRALTELLDSGKTSSKFMDFGGEIIPYAAANGRTVKAYLFNGYWEDIGTIKSYYEENLKLARSDAPFEFCDPRSPIYTSPRFLPPAHIHNCQVRESIISHGCTVIDATVDHSVVGLRSYINEGCIIKDALIIGADDYESDADRAALLASGQVPLGVGPGSRVERAIVDKNARIGMGVVIANAAGVQEADREEWGYIIRSGVVVVMRNATIPDGAVI